MKLFGSSGIRRVVDKEFLRLTFEIGLATGHLYPSVVVGCDTRTSSDVMRYAFLSGLLSAGATASYAGVVPTPTIAYATRNFKAGAMITASHNPPQYNGIKLVNPDGSAFDADQRRQIEEMVSEGNVQTAHWQKISNCGFYKGAIEEHVERILMDFSGGIRLKVVVDSVCGAASRITPYMLTKLGCDVVTLNCEQAGFFPRGIEPVQENLGDLVRRVKSEGAALGIAHDGDGDRIAVIDEKGRFVAQDELMALLARQSGAKKVVTTVDASMLIDTLGFEVVRTKVGDAFVSDELKLDTEGDAREKFGGEASGCYIFPQVSLCPDAIYAAAMIVQLASQYRISTLIDQIPSYPVLRGGMPGDRSAMDRIGKKLEEGVEYGGTPDTIDGLRLVFSDGWLLIRPSGTEEKIRITAEAVSEQKAREIYNLGLRIVEECLAEHRGETV